MQVTERKIISDVRVAMDENAKITAFTGDDGTVVDTGTLEMEDIIRSKIADGVNAIRKVAPLKLLEATRMTSEASVAEHNLVVKWLDEGKGIGEAELPDDFLRLVMFKMSDWTHAATTPIAVDTALYHQQFSEWKGVRGNPSRPNIAIAADTATGKNVIQFFSCDSTTATAELVYIKRFSLEENTVATFYKIESAAYRAIILKTAALVAATYSNIDLMNLLNAMAQEAIG